jgi:hypothetical protein
MPGSLLPMTDETLEQLDARYWQLERQIQDIHDGKVVDGDPAALESDLLGQQDAIEFELGLDFFEQE